MKLHPWNNEGKTVQLECSQNELRVIAQALQYFKRQAYAFNEKEREQVDKITESLVDRADKMKPEEEWAAGTVWDWMALKDKKEKEDKKDASQSGV